MIRKEDLEEAIAECLGKRDPDANTCIKLAAFVTIQQYLFPESPQVDAERYSYASDNNTKLESGTEFAELINNATPSEAWALMDELMSTLQVLQPSLYNGVIRRLREK